jgi:hypothetical protein
LLVYLLLLLLQEFLGEGTLKMLDRFRKDGEVEANSAKTQIDERLQSIWKRMKAIGTVRDKFTEFRFERIRFLF